MPHFVNRKQVIVPRLHKNSSCRKAPCGIVAAIGLRHWGTETSSVPNTHSARGNESCSLCIRQLRR